MRALNDGGIPREGEARGESNESSVFWGGEGRGSASKGKRRKSIQLVKIR